MWVTLTLKMMIFKMFDELIANEIKRKQQKEQKEERPQLELPLPLPVEKQKTEIDEEKRVIIIDLFSIEDDFTIEI